MKRRLSLCLLAMLGSVSLLRSAGAQTPAPAAPATGASPTTMSAGIAALKLAQNQAPSLQDQQLMQAFVSGHLGVITGGSSAEQGKSRDLLITAMPHKSGADVAVAYVDTYAKILDESIVKLLKTNPPLRVKLLVGVVAAKAAERAEDAATPLSGTAEMLLQEQSEAALLWGMKTAKYVMPGKLKGAAAMYKSLLDRIVPVGSIHPGAVLEEAYQVLTLSTMNLTGNPKLLADPSVADRVKILVPQVHSLLAKRVAEWNAGVPKDPAVDREGTSFLTIPAVWDLQTPAEQKQTLAYTYDLLNKAAPAFIAAQPGTKEPFRDLISKAGGAMFIIGDKMKDDSLKVAGKQLSGITSGTTAEMLQGWMASLTAAVTANPLMKGSTLTGGPATQSSVAPVGQAAATK